MIAGSIREFGFNNPVLVDGTSGIIAGHGRVLAARKLGMERVPVIALSHLSAAQKRAYILADNRLAEQAGWDREVLGLELADLSDLGIDLGDIGFDGAELDALLNHGGVDPKEEATPEIPDVPISRPGDVWQLGAHRLMCGDATDAAAVALLLNADHHAQALAPVIAELQAAGHTSLRSIAAELTAQGMLARRGGRCRMWAIFWRD